VGDSIYYWSAVLFGYTIFLGLTVLIKRLWVYVLNASEVSRQEKAFERLNNMLILTTLVYSMAVGGYYVFSDEFWKILKEREFMKSVGIIFGFLFAIFLLGRSTSIQKL